MSENQQRNDDQEFIKLSDNRIYSEDTMHVEQSPYKKLLDDPVIQAMPPYVIVGIVIGICIGVFLGAESRNKPKRFKRRKNQPLQIIRPEFREETKSERAHRMAQRKKYGIFDENGKRIDKL